MWLNKGTLALRQCYHPKGCAGRYSFYTGLQRKRVGGGSCFPLNKTSHVYLFLRSNMKLSNKEIVERVFSGKGARMKCVWTWNIDKITTACNAHIYGISYNVGTGYCPYCGKKIEFKEE